VKCDIVKYGDDALRQKSIPVEKVDDSIRRLAEEMLETMHASEGIGLAAEQVGRTESIFVIDIPRDRAEAENVPDENAGIEMPMVLINPEILSSEGTQVGAEGCLSFPGIFVDIKRAERVSVRYTDLESRDVTAEATGLLARAIQHEMDHLNGVLLVDRMSPVQKVALAGKLKRLKRGLT